ncbi:hypothetical protein ACTA71_009829 [Dictyostelium dimigraforme]
MHLHLYLHIHPHLSTLTTFPSSSLIYCNNVPGLTTSSQPIILRTSASNYELFFIAKAKHDLREQDSIRQEQDEQDGINLLNSFPTIAIYYNLCFVVKVVSNLVSNPPIDEEEKEKKKLLNNLKKKLKKPNLIIEDTSKILDGSINNKIFSLA